jgi:hypothetical protein
MKYVHLKDEFDKFTIQVPLFRQGSEKHREEIFEFRSQFLP